jgi:CRISPR system Cascade subunit CasD
VGNPILLLRFEGPLQSWGGRSRWDVRDTQAEPTKSGVIGLLGCAFGFERGDTRLEELDQALRFGVRVEHPGHELEDYQTITEYLPTAEGSYKHSGTKTGSSLAKIREGGFEPSTIISPRSYLEDAAFLVALEARNLEHQSWLEEAAQAIQAPRWTLFLGRKTCVPTRPIFEQLSDQYNNLEDALTRHPWSWDMWNAVPEKQRSNLERRSEIVMFLESDHGALRRQDSVRINPMRQYGFLYLETRRIPIPGGA